VHEDVAHAEVVEGRAGAPGQEGDPLDRRDRRGQAREHRGLVAGAGPDLEHRLATAQLERLGHEGDDARRRDRLPVADGQRDVLVGAVPERLVDEPMAGNPGHHVEHARIAHALLAQAFDQPLARAAECVARPPCDSDGSLPAHRGRA
jgi:hypothetical protein